jgi:hypothetical protein
MPNLDQKPPLLLEINFLLPDLCAAMSGNLGPPVSFCTLKKRVRTKRDYILKG